MNTGRKRKTTQAQFRAFCAECLRLQSKFGLTEWKLYFLHEPLDGNFAEIHTDHDGMVATLKITSEMDRDDYPMFDPREHAMHEMCHLLSGELHATGSMRWGAQREIDEAWERLTRRLEKLL